MALDDHRRATPTGDEPTAAPTDTDAAQLVGDEKLPCGRLISHVWEQARAGGEPDSHTVGCAFCRQAVEGLTALDSAVRTLRAVRPSAHLVADRVMRAVRAEARLGRLLPLDDPVTELWVAETAAAKVLRRAADHVAGVRAASCRLIPDEGTAKVAIAITLAMTLDHPLPGRAAEVRRAVACAAEHELGLAVSGIDLAIVSVLEPSTPTAAAEPMVRSRSGP
ncbi:hypothetical protein [Streptomyces botrytidirepellens]|uniref:Asp23/Gls24 family envelope stress response protein n=1 Tax=Streptomyces botrytidirepellens TaxID=2486417 RepID=A0A3M8VJH8_9ACTN|nr:hypothetical protein [Streptomyces botrytidirepellens]RNG17734.1 hypothetical protein EEJ42_29670 [Streptomyces botrytidirepellens]